MAATLVSRPGFLINGKFTDGKIVTQAMNLDSDFPLGTIIEIIEEILFIAKQEPLTAKEKIVIEGSIEGKSYSKIAKDSGYSDIYISKDIANPLWKRLGKALGGIKVSKTDFVLVLKQCSPDAQSKINRKTLAEQIRNNRLEKRNLEKADLSDTNLEKAFLIDANLRGANLNDAKLYGANLTSADLSGAELHRTCLDRAVLTYGDLTGSDLSEADLSEAKLCNAKLNYAKLTYAKLRGANLTGANLTEADLSHSNLSHADLTGANLTGANLYQAILYKAKLHKSSDGQDTDLHNADLSRADLTQASLSTDKVKAAKFISSKGISETTKNKLKQGGAYFGLDLGRLIAYVVLVVVCTLVIRNHHQLGLTSQNIRMILNRVEKQIDPLKPMLKDSIENWFDHFSIGIPGFERPDVPLPFKFPPPPL